MQDQRVAALEDQMAKTLLQCQQEKEKILNALKTERAIRKKAEADLKAANNAAPKVISVLAHSPSPAEEVQDQQSLQTPSAQQQCVIKQIVELALENAALKKQIAENALGEEAEKKKILEALKKERSGRKQERAIAKIINERLEGENEKLKQSLLVEQKANEFTKRQWSSQTRQANNARDERRNHFNETNAALKKSLNKAVQELSDLTTETTTEKVVLEAKLKNTESEVVRAEAEYRIKLAAMEETMTAQLAAKAKSVRVLEAVLRNTESEVVQGEAEYRIKLAAMQENMTAHTRCLVKRDDKLKEMDQCIAHLKQEHIELQASNTELLVINRDLEELAQRTDKEKAKLRKDAEKAAKKAAEKVAKEEKENYKKANELLKTQKKESEAELARGNASFMRWKWWNKK